jgi:hypothetical protein
MCVKALKIHKRIKHNKEKTRVRTEDFYGPVLLLHAGQDRGRRSSLRKGMHFVVQASALHNFHNSTNFRNCVAFGDRRRDKVSQRPSLPKP